MELVWLDAYDVLTPLGQELVDVRGALLSAKRVRDAYLGYASSQFGRLQDRGDGSFSADTRKRTAKHARHLVRLLEQGQELHTTGRLTIRLADPERVREQGQWIAADPERAREVIARAEARFEQPGVLPEHPDVQAVESWLHRVRDAHYTPGPAGA